MSFPYLESFVSDYSDAQRSTLRRALRSTDTALSESELEDLTDRISEGIKLLYKVPDLEDGFIDACSMNESLMGLKADLNALLIRAHELEVVSNKHNTINKSLVSKLHQSILRLDEVILTNRTRRLNPQVTEVKLIDFYNSVNAATSNRKAVVDQDVGQLTCMPTQVFKYASRGGDLRPKFASRLLTPGIDPEGSRSSPPSNAANPDNLEPWSKVVLTDSVVQSTYNSQNYTGILVQLDIELPQTERINEIKLTPFGRFPLDVIRVEYDDGSFWQDLVTTSLPKLELDASVMRFEPIFARRLRITFNQPNYVFRNFLIEQGQVKRGNMLHIMSDRALGDTIAHSTIAPRKLIDSRRVKAHQALNAKLDEQDDTEFESNVRAIEEVLDVDSEDLISIAKYVYTMGLRSLEVNYKQYASISDYSSEKLQVNSNIYEMNHIANQAAGSTTIGINTIEWDIDLGSGLTIPFWSAAGTGGASNMTTDFVKLDSDLRYITRFEENVLPAIRSVFVHRDGIQLDPSTYGISAWSGDPITLTLLPSVWSPSSLYTITYRPWVPTLDGSRSILDLRDSIKPTKPEVFHHTIGELNRLDLQAHPFILTELTKDVPNWTQLDKSDAIWNYNPPTVRANAGDPQLVVAIDGEYYGAMPELEFDAISSAPFTSASTTLEVDDVRANPVVLTDSLPDAGVIKINDEVIKYNSITYPSANKIIFGDLERGYNNTPIPATHASPANVSFSTRSSYRPIDVYYNGVRCINSSNYATGEHPAFTIKGGVPQYIQVGNSLYFNQELRGKIEVYYRRLADYIQIRARLYNTHYTREYTPWVNNHALYLKTATV